MKKYLVVALVMFTFLLGTTNVSFGLLIDFTSGAAYLGNGSTVTTNNTDLWWDVDYYVEDGVKFDFIGANEYVGNYYGSGNSVIHGHFGSGLTEILVTKIDNSAFDLNYLEITTNGTWGIPSQATITASNGTTELLPYSEWGGEGPSIGGGDNSNVMHWLSAGFDAITSFSITMGDFCFGMDNFFIDEEPPSNPNAVPEPGTILLLGVGMLGLFGLKRKKFAQK